MGSGSGTVSVTFVVLYLSGSGTASFSIGSVKFGHDILANTSVTVSGAGWYNTTIGPLNLNLGSDFYLNVYQASGSVTWGYTTAPTVKINTLTTFYYVGSTLTSATSTPDLFTVGGEVSPVTYAVTFSERGMPTAAGGGVAFNGGSTTPFTSGGTVSFLATDGTYHFVVTAGTGYTLISPSPGTTVTVNGAPVTVNIVFHAIYTVTFTETGLSAGASWSVTLNGTMTHTSTAGTPITFSQSNGTNLPFSVSAHGYTASPSTGTVTVAGANPASQPIAFTAVVLQNAIYAETNSTSIEMYPLPQIQEFTVGSGSGTVPVTYVLLYLGGSGTASFSIGSTKFGDGALANTTVNVNGAGWYNTSFAQINLNLGADYYLNVYQTSGSVTWGYTASPTVKINTLSEFYYVGSTLTSDTNTPDIYTVGLSRPAGFPVTFQERGMPTAAGGGVSFNGGPLTPFATGGTVTFNEPNGVYPYTVTAGTGYSLVSTAPSTPVTVSGAPVTVTVVFHELYSVVFQATGLTGESWGVTLNGTHQTHVGSGSVSVELPNGTYTWALDDTPGWHTTSIAYSGSGSVTGGQLTVTVVYTQVTYTVTYTVAGLTGETWGITLNGTHQTHVGNGALSVNLPYGTYTWTLDDVSGWHTSSIAYSGTGTVTSAGISVTVTFTQVTYAVTYTASGLTGETWGITLNGTHQTLVGNGAITKNLPNGTYTWTLDNVPGWHTVSIAYSGSGTVTRAGVSITVVFAHVT